MTETPKVPEFQAASYEAWFKLVDRDLGGLPFEKRLVKRVAGIDIRPLYVRADEVLAPPGLPGFFPYTRGSSVLGASREGWDVRQEATETDPAAAGRAVLEDLRGGATSIALTLDRATRRGRGSRAGEASPEGLDDQVEGVAASSLADLGVVLEHVPLDTVPVMIFAGASALPVAGALVALAAMRGIEPRALSGALGADPLGTLAEEGELPVSLTCALDEAASLAAWTASHAPKLRAITVDTSAYHDAGADAAIELAVALATGVAYLRALTGVGLGLDAAAAQMMFSFSVGRDFFVEAAKLRAARWAWANVVAACGVDMRSPEYAMRIHARTSRRTKTKRDRWVNLLRGTAESFSAAIGGADAITTTSFDASLGQPTEFGRRISRNTQHVLSHEANVHRVVDPAGGSWYVEAITEALARRAWEKFQAIEHAGGMAHVLTAGTLQAELKGRLDAERKAVETRKTSITGVNEFPNAHEDAVAARHPKRFVVEEATPPIALERFAPGAAVDEAIRAASRGARFLDVRAELGRSADGVPARVTALHRERLAQPFESLRDQADRLAKTSGRRPAAFLANLGPIAAHGARAGFAQNVFESGGFLVVGSAGFDRADQASAAFVESGAAIAVLCSSDPLYAELAVPTAHALRARGAETIVLAGSPGAAEAAYRAAGITDFIYAGMNVVSFLSSLLERAGARR